MRPRRIHPGIFGDLQKALDSEPLERRWRGGIGLRNRIAEVRWRMWVTKEEFEEDGYSILRAAQFRKSPARNFGLELATTIRFMIRMWRASLHCARHKKAFWARPTWDDVHPSIISIPCCGISGMCDVYLVCMFAQSGTCKCTVKGCESNPCSLSKQILPRFCAKRGFSPWIPANLEAKPSSLIP